MVKRSESEQLWKEVSSLEVGQDLYKFKCLSLNDIGNNDTAFDVLYEDTDLCSVNSDYWTANFPATEQQPMTNSISEKMTSYAVVILGELSVGKSALCRNFFRTGLSQKTTNKVVQHQDSMDEIFEDDIEEAIQNHHIFERPISVNGIASQIRILDVNTEKQFLESTSVDGFGDLNPYLDVGDGYIVTYAVTDADTFGTAQEILRKIEERQSTEAQRSPVILVGNKCDLVRKRQVSLDDGIKIAEKFNVKFIETSAALNQNVDQLFQGIVHQMRLWGIESKQCLNSTACRKVSKSKISDLFFSSLNNIGFLRGVAKPNTVVPKMLCDNCKISNGSSLQIAGKTKVLKNDSKKGGMAEKCLRKIKRKKPQERKTCQDLSIL